MAWQYLSLGCGLFYPDAQAEMAGEKSRWHLAGMRGPLDNDLNALGQQGWELAGIQQLGVGVLDATGQHSVRSMYVFKRPVAPRR